MPTSVLSVESLFLFVADDSGELGTDEHAVCLGVPGWKGDTRNSLVEIQTSNVGTGMDSNL